MHRLSGTALYVAAVLRTLAVYKPHPFRLTVDGDAHEIKAWLVAVGNGPAYGGGMNIAPGAALDDGLLDVTVVGDDDAAADARELPEGVQGHARRRTRRCSTFRGARVELESLDASVPMEVYADGERVGPLPGRDGSGARRADRARAARIVAVAAAALGGVAGVSALRRASSVGPGRP